MLLRGKNYQIAVQKLLKIRFKVFNQYLLKIWINNNLKSKMNQLLNFYLKKKENYKKLEIFRPDS